MNLTIIAMVIPASRNNTQQDLRRSTTITMSTNTESCKVTIITNTTTTRIEDQKQQQPCHCSSNTSAELHPQ
jgi:hypothetical protein